MFFLLTSVVEFIHTIPMWLSAPSLIITLSLLFSSLPFLSNPSTVLWFDVTSAPGLTDSDLPHEGCGLCSLLVSIPRRNFSAWFLSESKMAAWVVKCEFWSYFRKRNEGLSLHWVPVPRGTVSQLGFSFFSNWVDSASRQVYHRFGFFSLSFSLLNTVMGWVWIVERSGLGMKDKNWCQLLLRAGFPNFCLWGLGKWKFGMPWNVFILDYWGFWFNFICFCFACTCDLANFYIFFVCFNFSGEGEENLGEWKSEFTRVAPAPGPKGVDVLILAANRTNRPDILRGFQRYRGGWDIADQHYWAVSAVFSSLIIVF